MDVTEAFLNDSYAWDGAKPSTIGSTEAYMDGALTMQILSSVSGTPALFADIRHYHAHLDVRDLCNLGQHATWFAARSYDPAENLPKVHVHPCGVFRPRRRGVPPPTRRPGGFHLRPTNPTQRPLPLASSSGRLSLEQFAPETNERLMRASTYV
jgi:L-fucose/D-arabinose isomerase